MIDRKIEIPAPPEAGPDEGASAPPYRFYSPQHVGIASFLGGPAAGAFVLSLNYSKLGNGRAAVAAVTLGVLVVVALVLVGLALPDDLRLTGVGVALAVGMLYLAKWLQGDAYDAHVKAGGRPGSGWTAAGIGLGTLGIVVGSVLILALVLSPSLGAHVTFGPDEDVYYANGATEADARNVGRALQTLGLFDGSGARTVKVEPFSDGYAVSFVVQDGAWNDPAFAAAFEEVGTSLSNGAFSGAMVQVRLCKDALEPKKDILILRQDLRLGG